MDIELRDLLSSILDELRGINSKLDDIKFDTGYIETNTGDTKSELETISVTLNGIDTSVDSILRNS
jgi:hypothetical protein